jgi:sugar lactone lactonase YvrE
LAPVEVVAEGFGEPAGVVVDPSGGILVSDRQSGKVLKLRAGAVDTVAADLRRPVGLAFDEDGHLLIVEEGAGRLLRLEDDRSFTVLAKGMRQPRWVTVADDGTTYLSARKLKTSKLKENDDREVVLRIGPGGLTVFVAGFKGLEGIVVHGKTLYAAAGGLENEKPRKNRNGDGGGVFKIPVQPDGSAGPVTRLTRTETGEPVGLVRDALGAFYVSAEEVHPRSRTGDVIGKVAPDGRVTGFAEELDKPRGLALDDLGNLYVTDGRGDEEGRILRFRAPPAPSLVFPESTNQSPLTVDGTTEPQSRIDVLLNGSFGPSILAPDGAFALSLDLLLDTRNSLTVFATTDGGLGLSASADAVIAHDDVPPAILNLQPSEGSFSNDAEPAIRADFADNLSGVDASSVEIRLDDVDVTSQAQITDLAFTLTPVAALVEGSHRLRVRAFDRAGNAGSASSDFTVDVTPPVVANLSPADAAVTAARPQLKADFSDALAGIDAALVRVVLDGADVTSQAEVSASGFVFDPSSPLPEGGHTLSVSASDRAGNSASASSTFTVVSNRPPIAVDDRATTVEETPVTSAVLANDADPDGDLLSVTGTTQGAGGTVVINADGSVTYTPNPAFVGADQFAYSISDGRGGTATASVFLTVTVRPAIARVKITPAAALLTTTGETRLLSAQALDASGSALPGNVTWTSSKPEIVAVDGEGRITAGAAVGSAQIVARADGIDSAPAMVAVARPAAGAILVRDSQVASPPEPVDPEAPFEVGTQSRTTLRDIATPAPGTILIGTE